MPTDIPLSMPIVTREDIAAVRAALLSGPLVDGPVMRELEEGLANATGQELAITTTTSVQAVSLALSSMGIGPGADVLIPALGDHWVAVGVAQVGATPIAVDCSPATLLPNETTLKAALTPHTRAVLAGGIDGGSASLEPVAAACRANEVSFVELVGPDLGTHVNGIPRGGLGHASVVDLSGSGHVSSGTGGAVVTSNGRLHDIASAIRAGWYEHVVSPGPCFLPEPDAALACSQLGRLDESMRHCTGLAEQYTRMLSGMSPLTLPTTDGHARLSWARYVVRLDETYTAAERDEVLRGMRRHDILVASGPVDVSQRLAGSGCPVAAAIAPRTIAMPIHTGMIPRDVDMICQTLDLMVQRTSFRRE